MTPTPALNNIPEVNRLQLQKADYNFNTAFSLKLADHEASLLCYKVVRIIPGKRLVAFGLWNQKQVVVKIFFGRNAKEHMQRDFNGTTALITANIPAPQIYYHGDASDRQIKVIIFERILHAESLENFWQKNQNSPESEPVMQTLILELATQHVMGLIQEDLHLKNFLCSGEKIYTLDGGGIKIQKGPLNKKLSIENVALLFSQLGLHTDKLQQRLFKTYVQARSWLVDKADWQLLQKTVNRWNMSRWMNYSKKIFRSSTQFGLIKKWTMYALYDRRYLSPDFEYLLKNPDSFFAHPRAQILKAGRSATVIRVPVGEHELVIKRYNRKGLLQSLKGWLKPSRALLSWRLSHQLQFVGIPTAKPVAAIEHSFFGLRDKSYFIMEYIDGMPAEDFFVNPEMEASQLTIMARRVIILFFNLARLRLCHGDLKITNILLQKNHHPALIDLDGMREHKSSSNLWHRFFKDMERFLENWHGKPELKRLFEKTIREMADT